jgi:succinyl-CoA synthetase alpha subunit
MAAVIKEAVALEYASDDLKNNKDVVLSVVIVSNELTDELILFAIGSENRLIRIVSAPIPIGGSTEIVF